MHSFFVRYARHSLGALVCVAAFVAAGCHGNPNTSGYGIAWVTLTDEPGDFTSYVVTVDSVTLTGENVGVVTAVATPETVDFSKLDNIAELWASASIPNDTYTSANITLDYTSAVVSVLVNGQSELATVVDSTGTGVTTISVTVNFAPDHPLVITPTYASTSAQRLAIDFNLPASNDVDLSASPPLVHVRPFLTVGTQPADNKLIRVRGPLINSSINAVATGGNVPGAVGTYTVYVRPFYDEVDSLGTLSLFNTPSTIYTINGVTYIGVAGIDQLQQLSAGTTVTAAYTTFLPTVNDLPTPPATAGIFYPVYVIAGSSLEDIYTEGLTGYVTARSGNTLTLSGSTLVLNDEEITTYNNAATQLLVGPVTTVTADDNTTLTGLNSDSIGVGQYVFARGIYSLNTAGVVTLDATGDSSTNTGSVRLLSTDVYGSLVSSSTGSLVMNVQSINNWPVSSYDFSGNGATAPSPAAFVVNTGTLAPPAGTVAGDPVFVDGVLTPFGSAPPDFHAFAVNSEASVQVAGGTGTPAGTQGCGSASTVCQPGSLRVIWTSSPGTDKPFAGLTAQGFSIDLSNTELYSAVLRIGPESVDLKSLPASPQVVPTDLPASSTFLPRYTIGNPTTSSVTPSVTTATTAIQTYASFADFVGQANDKLNSTNPAIGFEASGVYNRSNNTFTATSINLVL